MTVCALTSRFGCVKRIGVHTKGAFACVCVCWGLHRRCVCVRACLCVYMYLYRSLFVCSLKNDTTTGFGSRSRARLITVLRNRDVATLIHTWKSRETVAADRIIDKSDSETHHLFATKVTTHTHAHTHTHTHTHTHAHAHTHTHNT